MGVGRGDGWRGGGVERVERVVRVERVERVVRVVRGVERWGGEGGFE